MGERETVTAGAWKYLPGEAERTYTGGALASVCGDDGWVAFGPDSIPLGVSVRETGQAGRDAADAALRAAGVVLL
jgi:hypothetical protein